MCAYWIPGNTRTCPLRLVKWWELITRGIFLHYSPGNRTSLSPVRAEIQTISTTFVSGSQCHSSPIKKKLIVKAFVSNLQLTNRQLCTKGKSATQSNTPEGYSISTACKYNTCNCPEYNPAGNAIKHWGLLWNRCGLAHLCSSLPSPGSPKRRSRGVPRATASCRAARPAPGTDPRCSRQTLPRRLR